MTDVDLVSVRLNPPEASDYVTSHACQVTCNGSYVCTREIDHAGPHVAHVGSRAVVAWCEGDDEVSRLPAFGRVGPLGHVR